MSDQNDDPAAERREFGPARVRTAGYLLIVFGVAAAMSAVYLGRDPRSPTR